jgi:hypothetical protein
VSIDAALRQLLQAGGRELDPAVVTAVVEAVRELRARHPDLMSELAADAEHYDYTASRRLLRRAADSVTRAA